MTPILDVDGIAVRYGERPVLRVNHLSVLEGEVLAVIGPTGAGKSTLFRVLGLLQRPTEGTVRYRRESVDWGSDLVPLRRRMASAFQEPFLCDATAFSNVALGLTFRRLPAATIRSRVERWLGRLGVGPLAGRQARRL